MNFVWVFVGGGLGSVLRYFLGLLFQKSSLSLPIATLTANVGACIVFALSIPLIQNKVHEPSLRLFLLTGFCGGLSTFSTFGYETWLLMKENNYVWAFANVLISVALCFGAFALLKNKLWT